MLSRPEREIAFKPTTLAVGEAFYGRTREMALALQLLSHGQSVLISGESRIGKSSFMTELRNRITLEFEDTRVLQIDAYSVGSLETFVSRLIHELGGHQGKDVDALEHLLKRLEPVFICVDEFDSLMLHGGDQASLLIKAIIDSGHSVFCAASRYSQNHVGTDASRLFPTFNLFQEIPLAGFTVDEAKHFLSDASTKSGETLSQSEIDFVVTFVGLIPIHLQSVGFNLFAAPGFISSIGAQRLQHFTDTVEEFTTTRLLSTLARFKDDPFLLPEHLDYMESIANDDSIVENELYLYLKKRGFLSESSNPFEVQGTLLKEVLSVGTAASGTGLSESKGYVGDVIKGAVSAAINAAVKTMLT